MLKLEELDFGYQIKCCQTSLNFNAKLGSFISITGVNGVGKSTLIKTILGDIGVLNGRVLLNGVNINLISLEERASLISIVTSKFNSSLNLTVKDVLQHADITNRKKIIPFVNSNFQNQVNQILLEFGVEKLIDKQYSLLSSGQQQLILIARAILQNTDMIILDEPTAFLDVKNKLLIFNMLQKLAKKGKLILLISHDVDLVYKYSDSILFLDKYKYQIVDKKEKSLDDFYQMFSV